MVTFNARNIKTATPPPQPDTPLQRTIVEALAAVHPQPAPRE
jgi:hypothetical protein